MLRTNTVSCEIPCIGMILKTRIVHNILLYFYRFTLVTTDCIICLKSLTQHIWTTHIFRTNLKYYTRIRLHLKQPFVFHNRHNYPLKKGLKKTDEHLEKLILKNLLSSKFLFVQYPMSIRHTAIKQ